MGPPTAGFHYFAAFFVQLCGPNVVNDQKRGVKQRVAP